jgi:hypothetical protein
MIRHEQNRTSTLENAEFLPSLDGQNQFDFLRLRCARSGARPKNRLHVNRDLLKPFNVIWAVQSPAAKIFCFSSSGKRWLAARHPVPLEGRFAIVTDVGTGCGGHGCAFDERR